MTTVGNVIDRIYREYLRKPDDQPITSRLTADLTAVGLSATVATVFTPEEQELLGSGTVVEVGSELMTVSSYNSTTGVLTLLARGVMGTTATTHATGDEVTVAPHVSRKAVFDSVSDSIGRLYPDLFTVTTFRYNTGRQLNLLPSSTQARQVVSARVFVSGEWADLTECTVVDHPYVPNGRAIQFPAYSGNHMAHVTVTVEPSLPSAEADELSDLNVEESWLPIIMVDAVAALLHTGDMGRIDIGWLTEAIETSVLPVGSVEDLAVALERYRARLLQNAINRLHVTYPAGVYQRSVL